MKNKEEMHALLKRHIIISRNISKHFLKIGKSETSTIIEHTVDIVDGEATMKTRITLLPIRRMYGAGTELIDDDELTYEMEEDIRL